MENKEDDKSLQLKSNLSDCIPPMVEKVKNFLEQMARDYAAMNSGEPDTE